MRVLHVLDHSIPLHSGYTFRTRSILREQRALGWETFHVTGAKQGSGDMLEETSDGLHFYRTPTSTGPLAKLPVLNQKEVIDGLTKRLAEQSSRHDELSAQVDLALSQDREDLVRAALDETAGVRSFGPVGQGDFLRRLGILQRAEILKRQASDAQRHAVDASLARLIGPDQMGTLFRVLALGDDRSGEPAGFADAPSD